MTLTVVMCALLLCVPPHPEPAPSICPPPSVAPDRPHPDPARTACPSPRVVPVAEPGPETVRGTAERGSESAPVPPAEPTTVQMVHYVSTTPAPAETVARFVGNVSTVFLFLLAATVLVLRLTVGWPRFPTPYLGRRRAGSAPDDPW
ncbi:hypothetical protein PWG71_24365 [Nocardiopsis sp. N85]|uniref:hypothetical protein n=1 Tax=Nocardiopsis sp. N85 TaxID=3029400 RepID=UPI00237FD629|nr:hypothetical protein [Nocardiopsis sp. N85]MDE3724537.1 hypothetical protein [Nocardiopsis sp. N85]